MGMAEFFALEPDRPRKAFYRSDELSEIGKGQISYRQVGDNLFGRELQILKERYETGRRHRAHSAGARWRGRRHRSLAAGWR